MLVILTLSLSKGKNPRILHFAFLVVIPEGDLLLSLSLSLPFSCHPSPQAEDLLLSLPLLPGSPRLQPWVSLGSHKSGL
jgi:hypothetical protein